MKKNESKVVDGELFRQMVISGANDLFNHYPEIDKLNVFPVPDGDTGTNMNLTISSGAKEILNIRNNNIAEVSKIFSRGLLMGARGNSGVILSQIFRGISQGLVEKETATIEQFALALKRGSEVAYKAVMKPTEGTILTVIRESSEELLNKINKNTNITEALEILLNAAKISLKNTPNLLPVLKEVGVVDSGGAGLVQIFEGMHLALLGEMVERKSISRTQVEGPKKNNENLYKVSLVLKLVDGKKPFDEEIVKKTLEGLGEVSALVKRDNLVKIEIKTHRLGGVANSMQVYGEFIKYNVSIDTDEEIDMSIFDKAKEWKKFAIISTCAGSGLEELFRSVNVDYIVSGGQTMNPSTEDFIKAIKEVHAKNIVILPNNKNIIMAAQQACEVAEDCECKVVPSKTILQGLVACMMYNPESDFESIIADMNQAIGNVKSGSVTFSIKDTVIDGVNIKKDHFMGISDGKIMCCVEDKHACAKQLINSMIDENSSIVTLIMGEDVENKDGEELVKYIEDNYGVEVELHKGNQPVYSYLIGVE